MDTAGRMVLPDDLKFCLYRLLMAVPWPASSTVGIQDNILSSRFGQLFDSTSTHHHRIRAIANYWVNWAATNIQLFFNAWREDAIQQFVQIQADLNLDATNTPALPTNNARAPDSYDNLTPATDDNDTVWTDDDGISPGA